MNILQQKIESLLFYKNEPVSYTWLAKILDCSVSEIKESITDMHTYYTDRGIALLTTESEVSLATAASASTIISDIAKKEDIRELSKQALETLAIIIYKKSVSKSEIDFIRGVNSVFILRNLLIRGLIEKEANPDDKRSPLYTITHDTLSFLGIHDVRELVGYTEYTQKLDELHQEYAYEQVNEK